MITTKSLKKPRDVADYFVTQYTKKMVGMLWCVGVPEVLDVPR